MGIAFKALAAGREPMKMRSARCALAPYNPAIGGRGRAKLRELAVVHHDALGELQDVRRRSAAKQPLMSANPFEKGDANQKRDAQIRSLDRRQRELFGELERRIGDYPVRAKIGRPEEIYDLVTTFVRGEDRKSVV